MHWSNLPTRDFSRWVWNHFFLKLLLAILTKVSFQDDEPGVRKTRHNSSLSDLGVATKLGHKVDWGDMEIFWFFTKFWTSYPQSGQDFGPGRHSTFAISPFGSTFMIFKILTILDICFAWSERCHHIQPPSGRCICGSRHDIQDLQLIQWAFQVHSNVLRCQTKLVHYRKIFKSTPKIRKWDSIDSRKCRYYRTKET